MNLPRARQLIGKAIQTFRLDLHGCTVLTEAATGPFVLTPLVAALGGARKVLSLARDSRYGTARAAESAVREIARAWQVESIIEVLFSRDDTRISSADLVTNLGFVRPLDAEFLARLKPTVVIPLMCETWEWRIADIDLAECRRRQIPVLGTDEHHVELQIFGYLGHLAMKLMLEAEIEPFRSGVVVLGSAEFAEQTVNTLRSAGADVSVIVPGSSRGPLDAQTREQIRRADALVVVEHYTREMLIGPGGMIEAGELAALNPALTVLHICGGVDQVALQAAGIFCNPEQIAPAGHMSVTPAYLGPRTVIDLHGAGLKVGQVMLEAVRKGFKGKDAETWALARCEYAQGFND